MAAALALLFVNYEDAVDPDALVDNCLRNVSKAWYVPFPLNRVASSSTTFDRGVRLALMYTFLLGFDVLVFSMTLRRSLQHAQWGSTPLIRVVIRDGTMSFGVISVICLAVILSFAISSPVSRGREIVLASNLSSILVNRMILNLRDPSLLSTREVQSSGIWAQRDGIPTYRTGGDIITTMHTDHSDEEEDMAISSQGCYTPESQYEHRAICAKLHQGDMRGSV
ncbi:hypothetical protein CC1G_06271 [Coprinopsis cinerea okayama7|uniref:Uncharacterized protein n=1 Tax=Coprinopsis cinerea (strain Okayama-7 / 130 / ATCC MYA-4618 / FGSC 9003) TaxID=240176 RepID=A8NTA9_COPC7|nr:hypothetical protein CC1G_06271 [Coprinopsis cinerea okayama7\|eukprot:XP_001836186.2 hypothetical protein CC1G_06271 [Coprinopsis cinerea okayama7\